MIHIVYGSTGEYSDHNEWPVVAYRDEAMAQHHCVLAKKWHNKNDCYAKRREWLNWQGKNPYDPEMNVDYTGTSWYVVSVELKESLPDV